MPKDREMFVDSAHESGTPHHLRIDEYGDLDVTFGCGDGVVFSKADNHGSARRLAFAILELTEKDDENDTA